MREIDLIEKMLVQASDLVLGYHRNLDALDVATKSDPVDLVTQADIEAQQLIVQMIGTHFPDDVIVGEESGFDRYPDDPEARCWVIDPIDGTHNYARALAPIFGVSIAFAISGQTVAAGIAAPGLGETFLAEVGKGATRNGRPIQVSDIDDPATAKISIDFSRLATREKAMRLVNSVMQQAGQLRATGSTVIALCDLANGTLDAYLHANLSPWDYAAGILIITEAGGQVSRTNGDPVNLFDGRPDILASNGHLHDTLLTSIHSTEG